MIVMVAFCCWTLAKIRDIMQKCENNISLHNSSLNSLHQYAMLLDMVSKIHIYPTDEHFLNTSMERGLNTLFNSRNTSLFSHYSGYLFFLDSLSVSIFIVPGKCTTISFMSLSRHHDSHIILVKSLQFSLALPILLLHAIVVLLSVLICTEMLLKL